MFLAKLNKLRHTFTYALTEPPFGRHKSLHRITAITKQIYSLTFLCVCVCLIAHLKILYQKIIQNKIMIIPSHTHRVFELFVRQTQ